MLPTREEISEARTRILVYNGTEHIYENATLSDVCYFSEWTGVRGKTKQDFQTVHTITTQTLKNALAAGYSIPQVINIPETFIPLQTEKMEEKSVYNALGKYAIHGEEQAVKDVLIDLVAKIHFDETKKDIKTVIEEFKNDTTLHLKPSPGLWKQKAENAIDDKEHQTFPSNPKNIRIEGDKIHFTSSKDSFYLTITGVEDMYDVWPCSGPLTQIGQKPIVVGAGKIIDQPKVKIYKRTTGQWITEESFYPENQYLKGLHTERATQHYEKKPNAFRDFIKMTHELGKSYVVQYEAIEPSTRPLGLDNTFWSYVDKPSWSSGKENLQNLKDFVTKRHLDPLSEEPSTPPNYGIIQKKMDFRVAQDHALQLMFRSNKIHSGIYILPCGAGKTLLGIAAAVRRGGRTLVITPGDTIANQWRSSFIKYANVWPLRKKHIERMRGAEADRLFFSDDARPVVIETIGALAYNADDKKTSIEGGRTNPYKLTGQERIEFSEWDLVIYDECHEMRTDTRSIALKKLSFKTFIGLTATLLDKASNVNPWHVDVAPVMYETAWPINNAKLVKIPCCHPFVKQLTKDHTHGVANDTVKTNLAREVINYTYSKPNTTSSGTFKWCLKMNPRKLERIQEIVNDHMQRNEPIALFSTSLDFIKWLKRKLIKATPAHNRLYFGKYLRQKFNEYKNSLKQQFADDISGNEQYAALIEKEEQKVKEILNKDIKDVKNVTEDQYFNLLYILKPPIVAATGTTKQQLRKIMYQEFENKNIKCLIQSKIGNTGVDIPSCRVVITADFDGANMAEDAQRFGRALRDAENDGKRTFYTVYTDLKTGHNEEKDTAKARIHFLKSRGYPCKERADVSACKYKNDMYVEGNQVFIKDHFFMTPNHLKTLQNIRHPIQFRIETHELNEEICELTGKKATFHKTNPIYESNLIMAEYICDFFNAKVKVKDYTMDIDSSDEEGAGDLPLTPPRDDNKGAGEFLLTSPRDDVIMKNEVTAVDSSDEEGAHIEPADIDSSDEEGVGEFPLTSPRDDNKGVGEIPLTSPGDDASMDIDSSDEEGAHIEDQRHETISVDSSDEEGAGNQPLPPPMNYFQQLVGKDTSVMEYGGMLLSHVNTLRQFSYLVHKCRTQNLEFHNPHVKGYIYGDEYDVHTVEKSTTTLKILLQQTKGYSVYRICNPNV